MEGVEYIMERSGFKKCSKEAGCLLPSLHLSLEIFGHWSLTRCRPQRIRRQTGGDFCVINNWRRYFQLSSSPN
ncbi:hypothetical protein WN944_017165 [Citrus x changshan-huyou]|uniref:Uncharacterized protein n=1 Tax=Citrus x changshan-huyou TaxID=2935761 RepID=A0AAP0MF39_9ROSI